MEAFDHDVEQRSLELLLSQERVVSLIYVKTFPIMGSSSSSGGSKGFGKTSAPGVRPASSHNPGSTFMMQSAGLGSSLLAQAGGLEAILSHVATESDDVVASGKE